MLPLPPPLPLLLLLKVLPALLPQVLLVPLLLLPQALVMPRSRMLLRKKGVRNRCQLPVTGFQLQALQLIALVNKILPRKRWDFFL
jgi:hypothetical protein